MSVAGFVIVAVLVAGLVADRYVKPRAVLAEVDGVEITRKEYWQYSSVQLYTQARQYEQFAAMPQTSPEQQTQFLSYAASFDAQRGEIWGSTDVNDATVQQMVEEELFLQGAEDMGIPITDQEVDEYVLNLWAGPDSPLITPTPEPTLIPRRAQWATETAVAQLPQQPGTPAETPLTEQPSATPSANDGSLIASPVASPQVSAEPGTPAATPDLTEARANASDNYSDFEEDVFENAYISREDYVRLVVRPQIARQKVQDVLYAQVGQTGEQVHAAHILVGTQELVTQLAEQVRSGASFEELAKVSSTDTATAPTGGDLGWFTRTEMVPPFADAAFGTAPGELSQPIQTQFGWHLIKVYGHEDQRALNDTQLNLLRNRSVETWLAEQRARLGVETEYVPTPTETPAQFEPPLAAPTPIIATPIATPIGSPEAPVIGPQLATPLASPPVATPNTR